MTIELSEQMKAQSNILAQQIIQACDELPPIIGIAALIAVSGTVCFNEANGEVLRASDRALVMYRGVLDVIQRLHQSEQGNGPLEDV